MNEIRNSSSDLAQQLAVAAWRKSTRSQTSNCVEVAPLRTGPAAVALRDSKDRGGPILLFNRAGWLGFIAGAKNGQFALN
ncbi:MULTISPECIES: DUF397 domain-containing protein [Micromonospora]|uniref:DUF397 domain-containing protein n=1 Tax=Micromonospora solifontis TaxID=2487138 RepID=A0ABX9WIK5_9ACTN|nr:MULTISPECIES: DUF397 domain-containing protein [Micromonospora]NES15366.1 DUF397 domain-containing protein [Micromonospora sp. PPF5-17B]NES36157.1 DUF397 domain-containing protein [Micromonospora solifontis]NES56714.1 DUF397 domain-containing protein [Micromonospora sp. PPF5-6]RNL99910.1 DUF397 domain-containing protein [Micromonospora solifontis]